MVFFVPPQTSGGGGGPGPPGPPGSTSPRFYLRFTHGSIVPGGGVQYLSLGMGVLSSEDGAMLTADGEIKGISITVNEVDVSRDYLVEVLSDPSGAGGTGPTVEATLALPANTLRARDRTLSVAVTGLLDLGVRLTRTSGAGPSTFGEIVVLVEVEVTIP